MSAAWDPIAIVGQACVLPGALNPAEYRDLLVRGECVVAQSPRGYWRLDDKHGLAGQHAELVDDPRVQRGGYVSGFERVFDPAAFQVEGYDLAALDPLFHWLLHCGRTALAEASVHTPGDASLARTELIVANLCFPSHSMSQFTERTWLELQGKGFLGGKAADRAGTAVLHPINRFSSGLCASLVARTLGVQGRAFALDAACASSLYGIKLACENLQAGIVDLALVLGSNRVDDLFLHAGFTSIQALSPSGTMRPFDADADGLVPAEGAAGVVLKRLADAIADGNTIHGVVRGVGVSNDGRGKGLLVPSVEGQQRALRQAYELAGWQPRDVSMVECHATGTPIGDAAEIETLCRVFAGCEGVPIGSHKSNIGHTMTASGMAGLLKLLASMSAGMRPASVNVRRPSPELSKTPLRLLTETEAWPSDGPRRAGLNSFGFGGNNAHLLLEQWDGERVHASSASAASRSAAKPAQGLSEPIAIVGIEVLAADGTGVDDFVETLLSGRSRVRPHPEFGPSGFASAIELPLMSLKFAPLDLAETLSQQLLILKACVQLLRGRTLANRQRTGVFVGMQCDTAVARLSARLRLPSWAWRWALSTGVPPDAEWLARASTLMAANQGPAGAIGSLPNVVANRIDSQFDIGGPSFSLCSDELSGVHALEIACAAIARGELDGAIVGAVDMSCEPVHRRAAEAVLTADKRIPGDAAVALELKSLARAKQDGDRVFAVIGDPAGTELAPQLRLGEGDGMRKLFGHAHAASGLLEIAAGALACSHRLTPLALTSTGTRAGSGKGAAPWAIQRGQVAAVDVTTAPLVGRPRTIRLTTDPDSDTAPVRFRAVPELHVYRAESGEQLAGDPASAATRADGPACLAIVASDPAQRDQRLAEACAVIARDPAASGEIAPGAYYRARPIVGEVAAVFAGAAAAYPSMGQSLLLAMPQILDEIRTGPTDVVARLADWAAGGAFEIEDWLWTSSLLSQAHFRLSREGLRLPFTAALGLSSGESNALFAFGVWQDADGIRAALRDAKMLTHELAGACNVLGPAEPGSPAQRWQNFRVLAEVSAIRELLRDEPRVHLTAIHAPGDLVVGGDPADCLRVLRKLGTGHFHALQYDVVVHTEAALPYESQYRALHHRPVTPVPGVRFYSAFLGAPLQQTSDGVADAITGIAMNCLDFPSIIERAYADGVRIFVEHGPRDACTRWTQKILGDREHMAIAFDKEGSGLEQLVQLVAQLTAAGVRVDREAFERALAPAKADAPAPEKKAAMTRVYPAHLPNFVLEPLPQAAESKVAPAASQDGQLGEAMQPPPASPAPLYMRAALPAGPAVPVAGTPLVAPSRIGPASEHAVAPPPPPAGVAPAPTSAQSLAAAIWQRTAIMHAELLGQQATLQQQLMGRYVRSQNTLRSQIAAPAHAISARAEIAAPALTNGGHAPSPAPVAAKSASTPAAAPPAASLPKANAAVPVPVTAPPAATPVKSAPPATAAKSAPAAALNGNGAASGPEAGVPKALLARPALVRTVKPARPPVGPSFDRRQCEILASGRISMVWGSQFAELDDIERLTRNPQGRLLLVDRITGIDAEARSMGTGTLWTETDIHWDSWFLQDGTAPMSIMVESGQADLVLISWLGADFINRGERVYRLLGCELRCESTRWPQPGDTLCFEIRITSHTKLGPVNLFFFEYDCRIDGELVMTVRNGQAGFFSDQELAESGGVLWDPKEVKLEQNPRLDPPAQLTDYRAFSPAQIQAFSEGDLYGCFGRGFEVAQTHQRSPRIWSGDMRFLDEVTHFEPKGGPWGRGYLRGTRRVASDDWFFPLHFKNDPCMPGTLMCEGALQAMAVFLTAFGYSLDKDGWRFAPVPGAPYMLRCRGQVSPTSREVVYEVFVREVHDSPWPCLYADVLGSCDGKPIFLSGGMAIQLAPDWPLSSKPDLLDVIDEQGARVASSEGIAFGRASILQCAIGDSEKAFGVKFGGTRTERVPRLPAPPYLAIDRVSQLSATRGEFKLGSAFEAEWAIDQNAWFMKDSGSGRLPLFAQLEAAAQTCRWAATFMALQPGDSSAGERAYRDLNGNAVLHSEVGPGDQRLRTRIVLSQQKTVGEAVLLTFDVQSFAGDRLVMTAESLCGLFPHERVSAALAANDDGSALPTDAESRAFRTDPSDYFVDLTRRPAKYFGSSLRLDGPMLMMIDEVNGFWPKGGASGLGKLRAAWEVSADDAYFLSQLRDPSAPDTLGYEAMAQTLKFWMIEVGMGRDLTHPRFRPIALNQPLEWRSRGRLTPTARRATVELEILRVGENEAGPFAVAQAWLWADDRRISHLETLGMQICSGEESSASGYAISEPLDLDPDVHQWLHDHCPGGDDPALPLMTVLNQLSASAVQLAEKSYPSLAGSEWYVIQVDDVDMDRWIRPGASKLRVDAQVLDATATRSEIDGLVVLSKLIETQGASSRVAAATVRLSRRHSPYPPGAYRAPRLEPGSDTEIVVYAATGVYHGAPFRVLHRVRLTPEGLTGEILLGPRGVPAGLLGQAALEAGLQAILYCALQGAGLDPDARAERPLLKVRRARFFRPTPRMGKLRCEVRPSVPDGQAGALERTDAYSVQLIAEPYEVWADLEIAVVRSGEVPRT